MSILNYSESLLSAPCVLSLYILSERVGYDFIIAVLNEHNSNFILQLKKKYTHRFADLQDPLQKVFNLASILRLSDYPMEVHGPYSNFGL